MRYPKKKRIVDKEFLEYCREKPCVACFTTYGTVGHHIKTVGSGGDDIPSNIMILCQAHHVEIHKIGLKSFLNKYESARFYYEYIKKAPGIDKT